MENLSPGERAALQHWSTYGQKGKKPPHRVTPSEWTLESFVKPISSEWSVTVAPHQLPTLLLGFLPGVKRSGFADAGWLDVGTVMRTHGFMSTSKTPNMGANEDKWFVYADGPDAEGHIHLHMHRSWTGKKMIELIIEAGAITSAHLPDGSAVITGIVWESDSGTIKDKEDAKATAREVCNWILDVQLQDGIKGQITPPQLPVVPEGSRYSGMAYSGLKKLFELMQRPAYGFARLARRRWNVFKNLPRAAV